LFSGATYSAVPTGGATGFTVSGSGNINDSVILPHGSTITYTLNATLRPDAIGTNFTATTSTFSNTATVSAPAAVSDPNLQNNSATATNLLARVWVSGSTLNVVGTDLSDQITIKNVFINGVSNTDVHIHTLGPVPDFQGDFPTSGLTGLVVYARGGNDVITVSPNVVLPALLFGEDGDDKIYAGGGPSVLSGGAGDDYLQAGLGNDILIGGTGKDVLVGGGSGDIEIGGTTSFDNNPAALSALLAEWSSGASYSTRMNHLTGATAGGLNGGNFLIATGGGRTVFDDGCQNQMSAGPGLDWFFANLDGIGNSGNKDRVSGIHNGIDVITRVTQ
jgi:Ca2+-binding RTX toxin-like protein